MDSKWNGFIDSVGIRVALNTLGWCTWLALTVGLLEFASKM